MDLTLSRAVLGKPFLWLYFSVMSVHNQQEDLTGIQSGHFCVPAILGFPDLILSFLLLYLNIYIHIYTYTSFTKNTKESASAISKIPDCLPYWRFRIYVWVWVDDLLLLPGCPVWVRWARIIASRCLFSTEDSETIMKFQVPRWGETFLWQLEVNAVHPSPSPEAVLTSAVGLHTAVF